jgi:hypothetical protein
MVAEEYLPQLPKIVPRQFLFCSANMVLYVVTFGTVPKSNSKIVEKGKIDSRNTEIHDAHLSCSVQTLLRGVGTNALFDTFTTVPGKNKCMLK